MTQTIEKPSTTQPSPEERTEVWFAAFEAALTARDIDAAANLFATESYWRDLVAFSWNLTTVEHPAGVKDLLENTLETTAARGFDLEEPPESADGVTTAWFTFERTARTRRGPSSPPSTSSRVTRSRAARSGRWGPSTGPTRTA